MKTNEAPSNSRRDFIKTTALATAGITIVPRHVLGGPGFLAPSDRLIVASIGVGGKGESDIANFAKTGKAEIAYLCDVDDRRAANSIARFPKAKYYKDFRELFDKESKNFDAVSVSTPDHTHAVAALPAMEMGKHVYVQKPLTHDIYEARKLTEAAKKYKVVTQMGNQGASGDGVRKMREWFNAGLIRKGSYCILLDRQACMAPGNSVAATERCRASRARLEFMAGHCALQGIHHRIGAFQLAWLVGLWDWCFGRYGLPSRGSALPGSRFEAS